MQITELTIKAKHSWKAVAEDNPLQAVVKLSSHDAAVETLIPEEMMQPLIEMVSGIVSEAAQRNVAEFAAHVSALPASKQASLEGSVS